MMEWIMNVPSNVIFVRGNHGEEFAAAIDILDYWFISYAKKNWYSDFITTIALLLNEKENTIW